MSDQDGVGGTVAQPVPSSSSPGQVPLEVTAQHSPPAKPSGSTSPNWIRFGVAALLAAAALAIWIGMAPKDSYTDLRASIEKLDDANNERTEGAPQQTVVNGWTTIDYLNLLSTQQEQSDNRRDALLLLGLLGGAAAIATRRDSGNSE